MKLKTARHSHKPPKMVEPLFDLTPDQAHARSQMCPINEIPALMMNAKVINERGESDLLSEDAQGILAGRFQKASHFGAVVRLLTPLVISAAAAAIIRPLNDFMKFGLESVHFAGLFGFLLAASCFLGSRKADRHEKMMAKKAKGMLESGRITSGAAQTDLCYVIRAAKDADAAFTLLFERKITFSSAELELAQTVFSYGTEAQARTLVEGTYVSGFAEHLLSLKCR
jgi:hypothetical protein